MEINRIEDLEMLPIVQAGKDLWQNNFHPHDVYQHTVEVVNILKKRLTQPELLAAGWLHDVGKPVTKVPKTKDGTQVYHPKNNRPYHSFPDHEKKGEEMVRELPSVIFNKLNLRQEVVAKLVGYHFLPMGRVKKAKTNPTEEFFCEQIDELSDELDATTMRDNVLTIFYADKASQQPRDLDFLFGLREYLIRRQGDLHKLYAKFISAYELK